MSLQAAANRDATSQKAGFFAATNAGYSAVYGCIDYIISTCKMQKEKGNRFDANGIKTIVFFATVNHNDTVSYGFT